MAPTTILVPLNGFDHSILSTQILPVLCRLFLPEQCRFILLHVTEEPDVPGRVEPHYIPLEQPIGSTLTYRTFVPEHEYDAQLEEFAVYQSQVEEAKRHEIEDALHDIAHELQGYDVRVVARFGDASEEIIRFVEQEPVDLVAMATHARVGIPQMVLGSVAMNVLRHIHVPILLLRSVALDDEVETSQVEMTKQELITAGAEVS
jgi:nucleotide-binding universal stress UspA family protein